MQNVTGRNLGNSTATMERFIADGHQSVPALNPICDFFNAVNVSRFQQMLAEARNHGFGDDLRVVNHNLLNLLDWEYGADLMDDQSISDEEIIQCMDAWDQFWEFEEHQEFEIETLSKAFGDHKSRALRRQASRRAKQRKKAKHSFAKIVAYDRKTGEPKNNRFNRHQIPVNARKPKSREYLEYGQRRNQNYLNRYNDVIDPLQAMAEVEAIEWELFFEAEERRELEREGVDPWNYDDSCSCKDYCKCKPLNSILEFNEKLTTRFAAAVRILD